MIWYIFIAFLFVPMVLQWMLLRWTETRFRFLRWTLLTLPALPTRRGWRYLTAPFEEYPHHEGLAGTLLLSFGGLALLGWAMGWIVYRVQKRREKP